MFIIPFYHQDLQNMSVTISLCLSAVFTSILKTDKRYLNSIKVCLRKQDGDKPWCLVYFQTHPFPRAFFTSFKKIQVTSIIQASGERREKEAIHKTEEQITKLMHKHFAHINYTFEAAPRKMQCVLLGLLFHF